MEVSLIRSSSQAKVFRTELTLRELGFFGAKLHGHRARNNLSFARSLNRKKARLRYASPMAVQSELVQPKEASQSLESSEPFDRVKLYVGLPLDSISNCNTLNYSKAIMTGLKVLSLLGVEGVEVPLWWAIVENEERGRYNWSGYHALLEMVQNAGLKLRVSLCFHGSKKPDISLPNWVSRIGESDPSIYFADRSGLRYEQCLSLGVDDIPILDGETPIQVYRDFCESFKASFLPQASRTITGVNIGLGPEGELRYPSNHALPDETSFPGVGEFQCYDKHMLSDLKRHAETTGDPLWGLGGPHDAPSYYQSPVSSGFFNDSGGSWESPYGDFFLSWYSNNLVRHGDKVLSMASSVFSGMGIEISGQVPIARSWHGMRSRPAELASGYYNTCNRNGYDAVAEIFAKNSCNMVLPGMEFSGQHRHRETLSDPESLMRQITGDCRRHGVGVLGRNSSVSDICCGFARIKKSLFDDKVGKLFTYHRMGAQFFSPRHFPLFSQFVKVVNEPELYDSVKDEEFERLFLSSGSRNDMQAA